MIDIVEFLYRVAAEADPPAIYNRSNTQDMEDYILPSDLVEAGSYLEEGLKREYISRMAEMYDDDEPMSDVIMENLEDFAAMDPVVALETLTGQG